MCAVSINDNPETRRTLYEAFLKSTLIIPIYGEIEGLPDDEWQVLSKAVDVGFMCGKDEQGRPILFAFTDVESLLTWKPQGCRYLGMDATGVFRLVISNGFASVVVNYKGPTGGVLTRGEIEDLAEGRIPIRTEFGVKEFHPPSGARLTYGLPAKKPPEELVRKLQGVFALQDSIVEAYLFQGQLEQDEPYPMVGLIFTKDINREEIPALIQILGKEVEPLLSKGQFLDFIELKGDLLAGVTNLHGAQIYNANT